VGVLLAHRMTSLPAEVQPQVQAVLAAEDEILRCFGTLLGRRITATPSARTAISSSTGCSTRVETSWSSDLAGTMR